ncbi:MAG: hypothetical protein K8R36_04715 [Planctomycetales bacterium]|nr:hypothetical protein [Planctomycetales bacterium]
MPLSSWLPLQNAAGAFREECSSLERMVQDLFTDLDRLSSELETKANELEVGRRHLAERGKQLAEQRKETARLSHQLEQQETQLTATLAELRELRAELASRPEPTQQPDLGPEIESLRNQITELQVERAVLLERLAAAEKQATKDEAESQRVSILSADSLQSISQQFAKQLAGLEEQIQASHANPAAVAELAELKQALLAQQEAQLAKALDELRDLRSELAARAESPAGEHAVLSADALQSLSQQFAARLAGLEEQIQASQPGPSVAAELAELKQTLLEQHETQLQKALGEMRTELATRAEAPAANDSEAVALRQQVSELAVERAVLLERLAAGGYPALPDEARALSKEALDSLTDQFARQFVALQEQVQALQQEPPEMAELEALKKERLELEAELDLVRCRSTALSETIALQKRELAEQRQSVAEELKEMRALIAEQTRMLAEQGPVEFLAPAESEQPRVEKDSSSQPDLDEPTSKPLDPVVNSVMAQFAKLQKDIAQRRKKK